MSYKKDNMISNQNIKYIKPIVTPQQLKIKLPLSLSVQETILSWRKTIKDIIHKRDNRILVIVGPCSIHDEKSAIEYATWLNIIRKKYISKLFIIMRVYFEKPRTTIGWKGLINDPDLDNSFHINKGLHLARNILLKINQLGLPCGCEFLDVFTPQYYSDLVSWGAIGARTTESQLHRQLASGLSMPIGFKNGTTGNIDIAVQAIISALHSHVFIGIDPSAKASIVVTKGNPDCHVILRGGKEPNYDKKTLELTKHSLEQKDIYSGIIIDTSHGNSKKNHLLQKKVINDVIKYFKRDLVTGFMIESNLKSGKQPLSNNLVYGQSITDACCNLDETKKIFDSLFDINISI